VSVHSVFIFSPFPGSAHMTASPNRVAEWIDAWPVLFKHGDRQSKTSSLEADHLR
jgi:hypothetical protein